MAETKPTVKAGPARAASLESQLADLQKRVSRLEEGNHVPIKSGSIKVKAPRQLLEEELAALEADPASRIMAKIALGLTEAAAEEAVRARVRLLRRELGIEKPARPAAGKTVH